MTGCVFCTIARDDPDGQVEQHVGDSVVITPLHPVTPGHKLVIPREHATDAAQNSYVTADVMLDTAVYLQRMNVGDCNVITSVGPAATQTVPHLHVHVVPRRPGDGLHLPWTGRRRSVRDRLEDALIWVLVKLGLLYTGRKQ